MLVTIVATLLVGFQTTTDLPAALKLAPDGHAQGAFPIAVWLQSPENAPRYKEAGFNLYVGLWQGPTEEQLNALKQAGMPVICEQNEVALKHLKDPAILAWMHGDEPDNAQSLPHNKGYGPPVKPSQIIADYKRLRDRDPSRPVILNLGQGVANDAWNGRGSDASIDDYPQYVKGCDLVSFDIYPVAGLASPDRLWLVPFGLERLQRWTGGKKPVWNCIECTHIGDATQKPTPAQVEAEVGMSLAQGSHGLIYFVHQFAPRFNEHALLDDPAMLAAVTRLNHRIQRLNPVLTSPIVSDAGSCASADKDVPIAVRWHRHDGAVYAVAASLRDKPTRGTFTLKDFAQGKAEVIDESRSITVEQGKFADDFAPFAVHYYRIAAPR